MENVTVKAYTENHYVNEEWQILIRQALEGIGKEQEIEELIQRLFIKNYVFVAKFNDNKKID